jgi:hypothetical protein
LNRRKKKYKSAETVETDNELEDEDSTENTPAADNNSTKNTSAADNNSVINTTSGAFTNVISPGAGAAASGSGPLTPYDESTDLDDLLADVDRIFGLASQGF